MDRTAWIVILLCIAGLFGWGWWTSQEAAKYAAQEKAWKEYQARLAAEQAEAEPAPAATDPGAAPAGADPAVESAVAAREIVLTSDALRVSLSNRGAGIRVAELLDHFRSLDHSQGQVTLNENAAHPVAALSTGPGQMDQTVWEITEETPEAVAFTTLTPEKLRLTKRFALPAAGEEPHLMGLLLTVRNEGEEPLQTGRRFLYMGSAAPLHTGEWPRQTGFYFRDQATSEVFYKGVDYFKGRRFLGVGSGSKPHDEFSIGLVDWAGVNDQFFTTLLRPVDAHPATLWASRFPIVIPGLEEASAKKDLHAVEAALSLPDFNLAPGDQRSAAYEIYLGPKEYSRLKGLGEHRSLVMKYDDTPIFGWMFGWAIRPFASGLIQVLVWLEGGVRSFGIAIILVTILIRILIWPVYAKSTRTMKRMSKLTPMMTEIREKYKDDQKKQSEELMKLYRDYGVNPLGGCLPMFIQLPVFLAFYGMLWRAAELRHQSFLWVPDLSMPDTLFYVPLINLPFNLLPLVMAATTWVQMSMTPKTGDKTQQMVFKLMPIIFLVICYNFASALALYWTTQNVFSIFQTWLMNRLPEPELKKRQRPAGGKGFFDRMQEQAKARQQGASGSVAPGAAGGSRTKLASEKGDRHTKTRKRKKR